MRRPLRRHRKAVARRTGIVGIEPFGHDSLIARRVQRSGTPRMRARVALLFAFEKGTTMTVEARLKELNIVLPTPPAPVASYVPYVVSGKHVYISGQVTLAPEGLKYVGTVGKELSLEDGKAAARLCAPQRHRAGQGGLRRRSRARQARRESHRLRQLPFQASPSIPKSPTAHPICSSRCSARRGGMRARRSAPARCRATSRLKWKR